MPRATARALVTAAISNAIRLALEHGYTPRDVEMLVRDALREVSADAPRGRR